MTEPTKIGEKILELAKTGYFEEPIECLVPSEMMEWISIEQFDKEMWEEYEEWMKKNKGSVDPGGK